jgi:hypothetical protein
MRAKWKMDKMNNDYSGNFSKTKKLFYPKKSQKSQVHLSKLNDFFYLNAKFEKELKTRDSH